MEIVTWILVSLVVIIGLIVALQAGKSTKPDQTRLASVERKLQLVMDHLGIVEPEVDMPDVVRALEQGNKIEAIKAYRKATGATLADAKAAVDVMAVQRGL
jgi:ribosomal protein L7/L12